MAQLINAHAHLQEDLEKVIKKQNLMEQQNKGKQKGKTEGKQKEEEKEEIKTVSKSELSELEKQQLSLIHI